MKNVVLLKLSNGNIIIAKNAGTVLCKSHAGPKASNVRSCAIIISLPLYISFLVHKTVNKMIHFLFKKNVINYN